MPIYSYTCEACGEVTDHLSRRADQHLPQPCAGCDKPAYRLGLEAPAIGPKEYQCSAIMSDGTKMKGHFGKLARSKR